MSKTKNIGVEVVYLGERKSFSDKIYHLFRDKDKREFRFSGNIKYIFFDYSYYLNKDDTINVRPSNIDHDDRAVFATPKEEKHYQIQKEIIKHTRALKKKAYDFKKPHPDIVKAIELLKPFTHTLDLIDLSRFTAYLKNQLSKKTKTKKRGKR